MKANFKNLLFLRGISRGKLFLAFTMTEVMIVMTILGVIATIMITTIKPAEYKEKALETAAKKVMNSIDHATTMILMNDSTDGTMFNLIATDGTKFSTNAGASKANSDRLGELYKKYLVTTRKECDATCICYTGSADAIKEYINVFYLKDGACISILASKSEPSISIFPGEKETTSVSFQGRILFDINGDKEPNNLGKDKFIVPLGEKGIKYEATAGE